MSTCEKGRQPEQVPDLLEAMQRQGLVLNVITCNSLISSCETGKQPERALELLEAMQRQGVVPDVITCNSLSSTWDTIALEVRGPSRGTRIWDAIRGTR